MFDIPKGFSAFGYLIRLVDSKGFSCFWQGIFCFWQGISLLLARDFPLFRKGFCEILARDFPAIDKGFLDFFARDFGILARDFTVLSIMMHMKLIVFAVAIVAITAGRSYQTGIFFDAARIRADGARRLNEVWTKEQDAPGAIKMVSTTAP